MRRCHQLTPTDRSARAEPHDLVPRGIASIGPGHVDQVRAFCRSRWHPMVAVRGSDSLARCIRFVERGWAIGAAPEAGPA
jgi:hypothetical protein